MTDWLDRLLKQESPASTEPTAAEALSPALRNRLSPLGAAPFRDTSILTTGALAAGLLREELGLLSTSSSGKTEQGNRTPSSAAPGRAGRVGSMLSPAQETSSVRLVDRAVERDARRYDGTFSLYE